MTDNTRHLANLCGYASCFCKFCHSNNSRRFAKIYYNRAVRRSKNNAIVNSLNGEG